MDPALAAESGQLLIYLEQSRYDATKSIDSQLYDRAAQLVRALAKVEKALRKKRNNEGSPA